MTDSGERITKSFVIAAGAWVPLGALACWVFSAEAGSTRGSFPENLGWFLGLWALSLLDLVALGKTLREVFSLVAPMPGRPGNEPENDVASVIRAFSWGTLKLICLGIFVIALLRGGDVSVVGRLLGAGTLAIVPMVGGLGAVRHA